MTGRAAVAWRRPEMPEPQRLRRAFADRAARFEAWLTGGAPGGPDVARLLDEAPQAVPRLPAPDADMLPRLALVSLALHALLLLTALLTALWHARQATSAPSTEVAVDLVQMPPPKPKPPEARRTPPEAQRKPPAASKPAHSAKPQDARQRTQPRGSAQDAKRAPTAASHEDKPGPMPAQALPGASSDPNADSVSYSQLVLSKLAKAKKEGRYMGVPGYAGVRFHIADDGSVESVRIVTSSGDPSLNVEAVAMVKRAAPYPSPPPGGRRDYGITLVFEARP